MSSPVVTEVLTVVAVLGFSFMYFRSRRTMVRLRRRGRRVPAQFRVVTICWLVVVVSAAVLIVTSLMPSGDG